MHKIAEYGLIFIVSVLLQVFLFDNLTVSPYLYPLVYAGCIILLPANIDRALLLILSFALGLSVDLLSGMAGLNTIAATATGFLRPALFSLTVGKDAAREVSCRCRSTRDARNGCVMRRRPSPYTVRSSFFSKR